MAKTCYSGVFVDTKGKYFYLVGGFSVKSYII